MANKNEISIEMIAEIATLAAKTAVDKICERKQEDIYTRCRGGVTGMKQHRYNWHSPVDIYAEKVTNSLHNYGRFKINTKDSCKASIVSDRLSILMKNEDNQTVKSL